VRVVCWTLAAILAALVGFDLGLLLLEHLTPAR
jgi:hypothetical protein